MNKSIDLVSKLTWGETDTISVLNHTVSHLKFYFGDHSTHAGNFVFQSDITGQLKRAWSYPAKQFASIMDLVGDKTIRISDDGVAQITVDSGVAVYNYLLPAQSK